ncbi:hypothetical protein PHLCEN_2v8552 [Hermanssonia centrifuga]|uniref:Uncharacterized protein n=1 Tax=Hermanssonia centrifuga TaxID=98765 RepID=A0A2R6NTE4_9APHY|nr:hypothetical protein PHLCEN_2v8552 [Hermanssonia centrifuga]
MDHPFFEGIDWDTLLESELSSLPFTPSSKHPFLGPRPEDIHLPQFTYSAVVVPEHDATVVSQRESSDESNSRAFAFSALFLSSPMSEPAISVLHPTPSQKSNKSSLREQTVASFIGFSWGPLIDAFKDAEGTPEENHRQRDINTPRPLKHTLASLPLWTPGTAQATPQRLSFMTPIRPSGMTPYHTLPRTGTIRRTAPRRAVSDREAMKQLVDCVGMSARKKVLESGRKPRTLKSLPGSRSSTLKELRFDRSVMVLGGDTGVSYRMDPFSASESAMGMSTLGLSASSSLPENMTVVNNLPLESDLDSSTATDVPYSPSPSPRPGSALSMMSRRSHATTVSVATTTGSYLLRRSSGGMPSSDSRGMLSPIPMDSLTPVEGHDLQNTGSGGSLSYVTLDEFDKRHTRLMEDILDIRSRLGQVSVRMTGYT